MGWFGEIWRRLRYFINRQQFERDLEEEMQLHKELRQQDYRGAGICEAQGATPVRKRHVAEGG